MIKHIQPEKIASEAVIHNGIAYISGQVADSKANTTKAQAKEVLANLDKALGLCGTDKSKLISVQVWLSDLDEKSDFNEEWDSWLGTLNAPARACVGADLPDGYKIELTAMADVSRG